MPHAEAAIRIASAFLPPSTRPLPVEAGSFPLSSHPPPPPPPSFPVAASPVRAFPPRTPFPPRGPPPPRPALAVEREERALFEQGARRSFKAACEGIEKRIRSSQVTTQMAALQARGETPSTRGQARTRIDVTRPAARAQAAMAVAEAGLVVAAALSPGAGEGGAGGAAVRRRTTMRPPPPPPASRKSRWRPRSGPAAAPRW